MSISLQHLPAAALHQTAKEITRAEGHWSRLAIILRRIADERLYEDLGTGYGSARAYAEQELDIHFEEYDTLMGLARLMYDSRGAVTEAQWLDVPKTHALLIRRAKNLGGDILEWLEKAKTCGTAAALRQQIAIFLNEEPWTTFSASMPVPLFEQMSESLRLALREATGEANPDPEMILARGTRFRCLEVITRHFLQTYRADVEGAGAFPKELTVAIVLLLHAVDVLSDASVEQDLRDHEARVIRLFLCNIGLNPDAQTTKDWLVEVTPTLSRSK